MRDHVTDDQLTAWIAAELSAVDTALVESHLEECQECAAKLSDLKRAADPFEERVRQMGKDELAGSVKGPSLGTERILEKPGSSVGQYKLRGVARSAG